MAANLRSEENKASNYNTFHDSIADVDFRGGDEHSSGETEDKRSIPRIIPVTRALTVEPALVLYYVAFMTSTPLQIQYINYRVKEDLEINSSKVNVTNGTDLCGNVGGDTDRTQALVQAHSAVYLTAATLSALIPSLVSTILLGAYSDRAGRKFALIPTVVGEIVRVFVCLLVTGFNLPLWIICIGLFAQGLTGGAPAFLMSCFSYIADVTSLEKRGIRIFIVELAMGLGQMLAQIAIGLAIANLGFFYTFLIVFFVHLLNLMYIIFVLPETLIKEPNCRLFTLDHFRRTFGLYFGISMEGKRVDLGLALASIALCAVVGTANSETITLFLVNTPLCWQSVLIGYYFAAVYAIRIVGSTIVLKIFVKRVPVLVLALGSLVSAAAYDLTVGLSSQTWTMFVAAAVGFASVIAEPMIRTFTSKIVDQDFQGALFASQAWVSMFCALIGAVMFNGIYSASPTFPGLVFVIAAFIYMLPFIFIMIIYIRSRMKTSVPSYKPYDSEED